MSEKALDKKEVISALAKSPHGQLTDYLPIGRRAVMEDQDFFGHLLAWNHVKGEVRDAKVALPIIALSLAHGAEFEHARIYIENALAHLADLNPRMLGKAVLPQRLVKRVTAAELKANPQAKPVVQDLPAFMVSANAPRRVLRRFVARYLKDLEADRRDFERTAVQHRKTIHELYTHFHVPCPEWVSVILWHGVREKGTKRLLKKFPEEGTIFGQIRRLKDLGPEEAAGVIVKYRIPFLIARGALGAKAKDPDQVLALIKAMSPTELVSNMKWLESVGVKTVPALRAALEEALGKAVKTTAKAPRGTLKTTKAAEALADDEKLSGKLKALQEKQIDNLAGIEGDWLVLGDKSGSMAASIETARQIAAILSRMVKGKVHLIFFDTAPRYIDATGMSYEELKTITSRISAEGGTSIGCGLQYMLDKKIQVEGIAIVSDGGENNYPYFGMVYPSYCAKIGSDPTVYLYQTQGDSDVQFNEVCKRSHIDVQRFDLRRQHIDYNSLPNLVQTMRVSRYQLLDEILATPLRTLDEVLERTKGMSVLPQTLVPV